MMEETSTQNIDKRIQMAVEAFQFLKTRQSLNGQNL